MATKTCPWCMMEIPDEATYCGHCTRYLKSTDGTTKVRVTEGFALGITAGLGFLIVCLIIVPVVALFLGPIFAVLVR